MRVTTIGLGDSIFQVFSEDHERLRDLLGRAIGACGRHAAREARVAFYAYEDSLIRHLRIEEEGLLITLGARTPLRDPGSTAVIRRDHREIERRLDAVASAFDGDPELAQVERQLLALRALLADHERREEQLLFPVCDQMFSDPERRACVHALAAKTAR